MSIPTIQTGVDQTSKPSGLPGGWEIHKKRFEEVLDLCDAGKLAESIELAKSNLEDATITLDMYLKNCIFLAGASTWEDGHVSYIVPSHFNCKLLLTISLSPTRRRPNINGGWRTVASRSRKTKRC
jgi:hypothetical protein